MSVYVYKYPYLLVESISKSTYMIYIYTHTLRNDGTLLKTARGHPTGVPLIVNNQPLPPSRSCTRSCTLAESAPSALEEKAET